ncbi:hypothetical protein [Rhodococcus sp. IEGM 1408]|uniref:hypothetical protein n=1 Tax=Rhodococcus sp. IEGM 1408 TaxID=3082220 RepID=UPI0029553D91|nr:hypothetical protein [Rhodococcus sp. IEGM 1408]MDV8002778.1 hypothetical protein [Rhodococcus sp. IEGM 1408]
MSSSPRSPLAVDPDPVPTMWWFAGVTCVIALPLWTLALAGVLLGVAELMSTKEIGLGVMVVTSVAPGLVCAVMSWRSRERVTRSGRWAGVAGAMILVGVIAAAAEGSL